MASDNMLFTQATAGRTSHMADDWHAAIAVLEERMKTMQAEYKTDIERLSKELAQRDRAMLLAILLMIGLAVAILKFA